MERQGHISHFCTHAGPLTFPCICFGLSWICVNVYCSQAKVSVVADSKGWLRVWIRVGGDSAHERPIAREQSTKLTSWRDNGEAALDQ